MKARDRGELEVVEPRLEIAEYETSPERFDRMAFAREMLRVLKPTRLTVALCEGARRVSVEAGRAWGASDGERWAILRVPPTASRRAIAVAVAGLATAPHRAYALETMLDVAAGARLA